MTRAGAASNAAPVLEVFASIQGEGSYVGEPQVFLRLRGCPLRCRWCDTPGSWRLAADQTARIDPARGPARRESVWTSPFQAACWVAECEPGAQRTVSVTGGEPLLWPEFLLGLRAMVGSRRIHLETGGAHPRTLSRVIDKVDHVSLDLKPDLDLDPPEEVPDAGTDERSPSTRAEWRAARRASLALVADRDACGKIVVSGDRALQDFAPLLDEVEDCAPNLRVILTPATPVGGVAAPPMELVLAVAELAGDRDLDVRVVPQVHRLLRLP
ncbi:MAG: 7-carboxy-7-deazaguanine synthase QueE [Planctomycetota bacterium]|nr:7-carboxy-7-deazaguanine synthase QueE [Planctomycetota bacterium]